MANLQSENSYRGIRYYLLQYWQENGDQRTIGLPLIREGPWPTLFVIGLYLMFVTRWGPAMMKKREPYQLRIPMLIYNTAMVAINSYFLIQSIVSYFFYYLLYKFHNQINFNSFKSNLFFPFPSNGWIMDENCSILNSQKLMIQNCIQL